jgi:hypothetical protein
MHDAFASAALPERHIVRDVVADIGARVEAIVTLIDTGRCAYPR